MRSHYCGQVTEDLLGQDVVLCGWVHRRRDHGGVIFIDLRDREGLVQVVFDPDTEEALRGQVDQALNTLTDDLDQRLKLRPQRKKRGKR